MCTTPEKHTMKSETVRNANQNKTTKELGTRRCMHPPLLPSPKESIQNKGASWNAEQNKNTNNNS